MKEKAENCGWEKTAFSIGKENPDLRYVEQLVDEEQTEPCILRCAMRRSITAREKMMWEA